MLHGNPQACAKALGRAGLTWDDIAVIEVNEAFASVVLQFAHDAGLEDRWEDVNPNGGGISLGHPLGATGARVTATLLNELDRRGERYGIAACASASAMAIAGDHRAALTDAPKRHRPLRRRRYRAAATTEWASPFESPRARVGGPSSSSNSTMMRTCSISAAAAGRTPATRRSRNGIGTPASTSRRRRSERAQARIPGGRFVVADVTEPRAARRVVRRRGSRSSCSVTSRGRAGAAARADPPLAQAGGWLLATMGVGGTEDEVERDWLGAPMFFASLRRGDESELVADAGFASSASASSRTRSPATGRSASCGCSRRATA